LSYTFLLAVRDFLEQLSSKKETVDEAALDEELRQSSITFFIIVHLFNEDGQCHARSVWRWVNYITSTLTWL